MKAIIPLNVAALRVSNPDETNVTSGKGFAGRTAAFNNLPYGPDATQASTGDTIWLPLDGGTPADALRTGVHLHWELPEYFKRGSQNPDTGAIEFPPAPTRWLVVRTLSVFDQASGRYSAPRQASWVVESDYLSAGLPAGPGGITRPAVPVPVPAPDGTPFMWMGRVVDAATWDPVGERRQDYLPYYTGPGGRTLRLTSIGFLGAAFCGYYPDCCSVFGFWDTFADAADVYPAITGNSPIRFRASYSVIGWLPDPATDPLSGLKEAVSTQYTDYVAQCAQQNVKVTSTPADVFARVTSSKFGWTFSANAISFTLDDTTKQLTSIDVPDGTLCAGVIQDVAWDQKDAPFLASSGSQGQGSAARPWTDQVEIAIGNTTVQAVSALVKSHLTAPAGDPVLASYEALLNALQLGVLRDLQGQGNSLATLEEALHSRAFAQVDAGHQWTIQTKAAPGSQASVALTLPLPLAEQLSLLNRAQLGYDQARSQLLAARQQLFMDWVIYVKQLCRVPPVTTVIDTNTLGAFLVSAKVGELRSIAATADETGLLHYTTDRATGRITGVTAEGAVNARAAQVVSAHKAVTGALDALPDGWELDAVPADPFWLPTDPVLVMEGNRLEPVRRNGPTTAIAVRADSELIAALGIAGATGSWSVAASALAGLTAPPAAMPNAAVAAAVIAEAALLDPQYAAAVAAATGAPDTATLTAAISACLGGQSPFDPPVSSGLFGAVRADGYVRAPDPEQTTQSPPQLTVTFTNPAKTALAPDAVGWTTQTALPEFSPTRGDPYLPVWMNWELRLDPLARGAGGDYAPETIETRFSLGLDTMELTYPVPATFTTGTPVSYRGTVVLSKKPFVSLTQQIGSYLKEFPGDAADAELIKARDDLAGRKVLSQALDTFTSAQTLRTTIPQIPVANLVSDFDPVTTEISAAATATPGDSWYDTGFNSLTAISTGPQSQYNYGPLRSGFLELTRLAIVDVFGQRMDLTSANATSTRPLPLTTASDLSPAAGDAANAGKAYLPPRVLAPARIDARWLSASFDPGVAGITGDFAEANDHPATTPVCGWIVPNHLDVTLAFYNAGGAPIGSFGLEHGRNVYRTRAGNTSNPRDDLELDIGPDNAPLVNLRVARLMRFIGGQPAGFLTDLMAAIENSDQFINPVSFAQDVALSVLIGRPLAIVRTVQSASTAGGVLPASQANDTATDALSRAVAGHWYDYQTRQASTSAGLAQVRIPVRLGELTDIDDGLVAFLPEAAGAAPYSVVYSAAAKADGTSGVLVPAPDTVELTLNGAALTFTAIVDPRAPVHVTTGVLPTVTMQIPQDQYLRAMQQLAVTFTTRPVLGDQLGLRLPLPAEAGYSWSWVASGAAPAPLDPPPALDVPAYGYSPQRLIEGWLDLTPDPVPPAEGKPQ